MAMAVDSIVLVVRWGRTERQFVQFALDSVRNASIASDRGDLKRRRSESPAAAGLSRPQPSSTWIRGFIGLLPGITESRSSAAIEAWLPQSAAANPGANSETGISELARLGIRDATHRVLRDLTSKDCTINIMISVNQYNADSRMLPETSAAPFSSPYQSETYVSTLLCSSRRSIFTTVHITLQRHTSTAGTHVHLPLLILHQFLCGKLLIQYDRLLWFIDFRAWPASCSLLLNFESERSLTSYSTSCLFLVFPAHADETI